MVIIVLVVMDGSSEVEMVGEGSIEEDSVPDPEGGRLVRVEDGGGSTAVVVGPGIGVPPGVVGITGGASVVGISPAGTKTVVVTKTVVTALGAASLVEKTVSVSVPNTTLCLRTVVKTGTVTVDVTVFPCLLPNFWASPKALTPRVISGAPLMLLFALRTKDVAVTVAVSICRVGSSKVSVMVLVALTTDVVGEPVNSVTVLVRVLVTKTVEAPGIALLMSVTVNKKKAYKLTVPTAAVYSSHPGSQ
jgi:hypothetical protein